MTASFSILAINYSQIILSFKAIHS